MPVDVVTEIEIDRPREEVAAWAADPDNAMRWYENIKAVEWETPPPLQIGSRIAFVARFLGSRLAYVYEVREHVPGERFVMSTDDGPFTMETTYGWSDTPGGGTWMTLRNRGEPERLTKLAAPMMAAAMRRANRKDLRALKKILESGATSGLTGAAPERPSPRPRDRRRTPRARRRARRGRAGSPTDGIVAVTNGARSQSIGPPRTSRRRKPEPSSALPAVAPRITSTCGATTASSSRSHGRHASTSSFFGVWWMRRLPRSSNLKCLTTFVM